MKEPNPGSQAATDKGCICPIMDNEYGDEKKTAGYWTITVGCPVHDQPDPNTPNDYLPKNFRNSFQRTKNNWNIHISHTMDTPDSTIIDCRYCTPEAKAGAKFRLSQRSATKPRKEDKGI